MSPLGFLGLAVAVNLLVFSSGIFWMGRQMKRAEAERAADYRAMFVLEPLPPQGEEVQILIDDEHGMLAKLDAVHWPHLSWIDATTQLPVEDDVLGWRWHPFRERRQDDPSTWSREKLAAELVEGAIVPGYDKIRTWGDEISEPLLEFIIRKDEDVRAAAEAGRSPRLLLQANYLAISGGGDQGAFAAGVLSGWSSRGDRPEFEVVTGVSAGALAAPFALIGIGCDRVLREVYSDFGAAELYKTRGLRDYFTDADGDNEPLRKVTFVRTTPPPSNLLSRDVIAGDVSNRR